MHIQISEKIYITQMDGYCIKIHKRANTIPILYTVQIQLLTLGGIFAILFSDTEAERGAFS